ncbi:hypothetical protein [Streptomyces sp. KR55]|uniref:hypothetical protein n=1 Tax=Streptomyces sp. KR55 TaxID=3457425 RepID=UPI003FD2B51C
MLVSGRSVQSSPTRPGAVSEDWTGRPAAPHRPERQGDPVLANINGTGGTDFPWRRLLYPFAIAGAVVGGGWGLVAALAWLLNIAAHTATVIAHVAGPIGVCGIALRLFSSKR